MSNRRRCGGFSLIEVLMAVGTLAIGMIFIGGTFLVAIHLSGVSAEQTTAAVVANEAFAKIRIFGVEMADPNLAVDQQRPFPDQVKPLFSLRPVNPDEFAYPSTRTLSQKQYFWSALCRLDPNDPLRTLQVTVFVSRKVGAGALYEGPAGPIDRPVAMPVGVSFVAVDSVGRAVLAIEAGKERWISPGYKMVEDSTGEIYRVVDNGSGSNEILLDSAKPWPWAGSRVVWVVPPPMGRGKGPCIEVYQGEVRF